MSSSLSLARVNGDTSFIITMNNKRFLVDPWLFGHEVDGCSCFNTAMLVEPAISIDKIGNIDAIIITHEFSDHLHEETLLLLDDKIPILATKSAIKRLKKNRLLCKRYIIEIPSSNQSIQLILFDDSIRIGLICASGLLDFVHNALLIFPNDNTNGVDERDILLNEKDSTNTKTKSDIKGGGICYCPHGFVLNENGVLTKEISNYKFDLLIVTMTEYYLPFYVGGTVNLGLEAAAALTNVLKPQFVVNCHSEKKISSGMIPRLAKPIYPTNKEIKEKINSYIELNGYEALQLL